MKWALTPMRAAIPLTAEKQSFFWRSAHDPGAAKFYYTTPRTFLSRVFFNKFYSLIFPNFVYFATCILRVVMVL